MNLVETVSIFEGYNPQVHGLRLELEKKNDIGMFLKFTATL